MKNLMEIIGERLSSPSVEEIVSRFEWEKAALAADDGFPEQRFLNSTQDGLSLGYDTEERVTAVYLYGEEHEGFSSYRGALLAGLELHSSREEVRGALGEPATSGEPRPDSFLGPQGGWDRFLIGKVCVHIQYTFAEPGISVVTLIHPDQVQ